MSEEFFELKEPNMKLPVKKHITNPQFQNALYGAKSLRAKLAICYVMLSQNGAFSDASPELWAMKNEVSEHTPEEFKDG